MLIFDNETKTIKIVAKDTGDFVFGLDNYELDDGDTVYFTVNDKIEEHPALISLQVNTFTDNKALFRLTTRDTDLEPGTYWYDIQVNTADGRVDTVLGPAKFKVIGGVKF
jgi:plastocyanin